MVVFSNLGITITRGILVIEALLWESTGRTKIQF